MAHKRLSSIWVIKTLECLAQHEQGMPVPMGETLASEYHKDPFVLLVSCLLSLRARDTAVYPVCKRLFSRVRTPRELLAMSEAELERILQPIGFFRAKARTLRTVCAILIDTYHGLVPQDEQRLLELPGVGPKTANFMLCYAFGRPAICVDTHVHRLANKFGWVHTKKPQETEAALQKLVPKSWWCRLNSILVQWGQQVCKPRLSKKERARHDQICPCTNKAIQPARPVDAYAGMTAKKS